MTFYEHVVLMPIGTRFTIAQAATMAGCGESNVAKTCDWCCNYMHRPKWNLRNILRRIPGTWPYVYERI